MKFSSLDVETIAIALDRCDRKTEVARPLAWHFRYHGARHVVELAGALAMARAAGIDPPLDDDSDGAPNPEWERAVAVGRAMQIAACQALVAECPLLRVISTKQNRAELVVSRDDAWPELGPVLQRATEAALEAGRRGETSEAPRPNHLPQSQSLDLDDLTVEEMRVMLDALCWAIDQRGYYSREEACSHWPSAAADVPPLFTLKQRQAAEALIARLAAELGETQIYLPPATLLAAKHNIDISAAEEALAAAEQVLRWHYARFARVDAHEFETLPVPRELLAVREWHFLQDQQQRGLVAAEQTLWQHIHRAQKGETP